MYVQYIILLSSYHCVFILFKSEIISYAKKWHIILLTYSTANNKHWRKKKSSFVTNSQQKAEKLHIFSPVCHVKVCGRQREAPKCRHRLTELKQLHCWSWRTNSKQQEKLTQPRQEIITIKQETDRERGTERARETWQTHRDMTEETDS